MRPDPAPAAPRPLPTPHQARVRRRLLRIQRTVSVVLAIAVWAMANYLSARHPVRFATRTSAERPLAGKTLRLLGDLVDAVELHILLRPGHQACAAVRALAARLEASPAAIAVEWVDPDRDLARAEQLCNRFRWSGGEAIFVETGGRHAAIDAESLVETDASGEDDAPPGAPPVALFRGESLVAGAIYSLVQPSRPALCFLQGHGERSPDDFDRRAGYSEAAALLRDDNWDVETLRLDESKGVPARCALLVAAGPTRPLSPSERGRIRDYLDRKGRLLLLLDARVESGYEPLLREWGVLVGDEVVYDDAHSLNGRDLHLGAWADHPVTRSLDGSQAVLFFPRPVRPDPELPDAADKPHVTPLLSSSSSGRASRRAEVAGFDPASDLPGPVPVAVAVERGPLPGVHTQIKPARMVVVGDSGFASNGGLSGANASFFLNAVNWLAERPEFLGVAPQPLASPVAVPAGAAALRRLFAWLVCAIPLLGLLLGFIPWLRRRYLSR